MELLEVTLTAIQRRNRAAFVERSDARPLARGERVVLRDERGEYFAGAVVDCDEAETGGGRRYLVRLGVRLPEDHALQRLGHVPQARSGLDDDVDGLLDLLGDARNALGGRIPSQRTGN